MKWVAALLLALNAAIYLWAGGGNGGGGSAPAEPDVNTEGMLLLSEVPTAARENARNADIEPSGIDSDTARPQRPETSCYRIGPFKAEADWRAATRWMAAQPFAYQALRSESRTMRAIRVFLGPFDSPAAAEPMAEWLKEQGVEHFANAVNEGGGGALRLSLGYFTQEELAVKFLAHLQSLGIEADSGVEFRLIGPFDWLEASVETARRDLLLARRWSGPGVAIIEVDCGEISPPGADAGA